MNTASAIQKVLNINVFKLSFLSDGHQYGQNMKKKIPEVHQRFLFRLGSDTRPTLLFTIVIQQTYQLENSSQLHLAGMLIVLCSPEAIYAKQLNELIIPKGVTNACNTQCVVTASAIHHSTG